MSEYRKQRHWIAHASAVLQTSITGRTHSLQRLHLSALLTEVIDTGWSNEQNIYRRKTRRNRLKVQRQVSILLMLVITCVDAVGAYTYRLLLVLAVVLYTLY